MKTVTLASRKNSFDYETFLIRPGVALPELVCLSWHMQGEPEPYLVRWDEAEPLIRGWLEDDSIILSGANVAFDMGVTCANFPWLTDLVFAKYRKGLVQCTQYRDRLLDVAAGKFQGYHTSTGAWVVPTYDLASLSQRYRGKDLNKPIFDDKTGLQINDSWRLRYGELHSVPLEEWPYEARRYSLEDATANKEVDEKQEVHAEEYLGEQDHIVRKAFALQLVSAWGVRTNPDRVVELAKRATLEREKVRVRLEEYGLVRPEGTRNLAAAKARMIQACRESGMQIPLTDTGLKKIKAREATREELEAEGKYIALSEDVCIESGDPVLEEYAAFGRWGTTISKDITALAKGTRHPIHCRYGMAATTRTTSSGPNMQNWGKDWGPRECIEPRPGHVFLQADYPGLENKTLAQSCIWLVGYSKMADSINAGRDLHLEVAAVIEGVTYEWAKANKTLDRIKKARQFAKIANFGFPGGLGAENFVAYAKANEVLVTLEQAKELKDNWFRTFPEMREYFRIMGDLCRNKDKLGEIVIPGTKQLRGGARFCALCNTPFQGLGAAISAKALWYIAEACYVDRKSPLFGARNVVHIHDENIAEDKDDDTVHEAAWELAGLMDRAANEYLVDVPMKTDPVVMRRWSKEAFALSRNGRLVPWDGEWQCEDCKDIFVGPHPASFGKERKCAHHTTRWAQSA